MFLQGKCCFLLNCIDVLFRSLPNQDVISSQFFKELGYEAAGGAVTQGNGRHRRDFHHQLEVSKTAAA